MVHELQDKRRKCFILSDQPVYVPPASIEIRVKCLGGTPDAEMELAFESMISGYVKVGRLKVVFKPGISEFVSYFFAPDSGRIRLYLLISGEIHDVMDVYVIPKSSDYMPIYLSIVYHQHQGPGYLPGMLYRYTWHIKHVVEDELGIALVGGAYRYHALIGLKYPEVKTVHHLSPSLLRQWKIMLENGYIATEKGDLILGSEVLEKIENTLEIFKHLIHSTKSIEPLTSVYAHTILGYLIHRFNMIELVRDELEFGASITEEVLGYKAEGVWTPEMAFSPELIRIYSDSGFKYTILDAKYHILKPYINPYRTYEATYNGYKLGIVFRDTELSNTWSFKNSYDNEAHAYRAAHNLIQNMVLKALRYGGKSLVTIALDGENWLIFSRTPREAALFLDTLYSMLSKMQSSGIVKTVTLSEALKNTEIGPIPLEAPIPVTTWLGSFSKWDGQQPAHAEYWRKIEKMYKNLKIKESSLSPKIRKAARWSLYHALNSDYWWAEFWDPNYIDAWLKHLEMLLSNNYR
jgi:alpha-amylase/alpha-mannosidase (GH57 family)